MKFIPRVQQGCIPPYGFSILSSRALFFKMALPFVWKDYDLCLRKRETVWGQAHLIIAVGEWNTCMIAWLPFDKQPEVL